MEFSEVITKVEGACFSPDNNLIALNCGVKVIIKSVSQFTNVQTYTFTDTITNMEFSPDSNYFLVCKGKRGVAEARAVYDEDWSTRVEDPFIGLLYARWSPDSRNILTFSDYQLRVSIYSLIDRGISYIKQPKFPDKGISFTNDGKFMALAERRETKDYIGIYYCADWKLVNYIPVDTNDLSDIRWAPDNSVIIAWESQLEYRLLAYCPARGLLAKFQPYQYAMGIKSLNFSKNSEFLAVGSYDEKVRLINCLTWKIVSEFEHKATLTDNSELVDSILRENCGIYNIYKQIVFKEEEIRESLSFSIENLRKSTKYVNLSSEGSLKIPTIKVPIDKANPTIGVGEVAWSPDGNFLATKNDNMPNTLWIWDVLNVSLKVVLIQLQPIKHITWSDNSEYLVFCTGTGRIFFWCKDGASVCDVPFEGKSFTVQKVDWTSDSKAMILYDKNEVVIAYPPKEFLKNPVQLEEYPIPPMYNQSIEIEKENRH